MNSLCLPLAVINQSTTDDHKFKTFLVGRKPTVAVLLNDKDHTADCTMNVHLHHCVSRPGLFGELETSLLWPARLDLRLSLSLEGYAVLNGEVGCRIAKRWRISAEILNLLSRCDHDIDYAYQSRIMPTAAPAFTDIFLPVNRFRCDSPNFTILRSTGALIGAAVAIVFGGMCDELGLQRWAAWNRVYFWT